MPQLLIHYVTDGVVAVALPEGEQAMQAQGDGWWALQLSASEPTRYGYVVRSGDGILLSEDRTPRELHGDGSTVDRWIGHDSAARARRSAIFTKVLANGYSAEPTAAGRVTFRLLEPNLEPEADVRLTGETDGLGNWDPASGIRLRPDPYPWWTASVDLPGGDYEYKFVVDGRWEDGANRFARIADRGPVRVDDETLSGRGGWRGAGVALPVFSLRTRRSLGVGQFTDLRPMVDWAHASGFSMIQLLPVNDTRKGDGWRDSYPYSPVSAFALHPLYVDIEAIPGHEPFVEELGVIRLRLEALPEIAYEQVMAEKLRLLRLIYAGSDNDDPALADFVAGEWGWLGPYAAWQTLRAAHKTKDTSQWGEDAEFDASRLEALRDGARGAEMRFHCWVQFHLNRQLASAVEHARARGVALKGDLPIGVSPASADVWQHPELFHSEGQAGAPPDPFAFRGQNWGFPTYDWDAMERDGYAWWRNRFAAMAETMDAYRIDHVLGFFRIWEVPADAIDALLGHFRPCLPWSRSELAERFGDVDTASWARPVVDGAILAERFGSNAPLVMDLFFEGSEDDLRLREGAASQRDIATAVAEGALDALDPDERTVVERKLLDTAADVLLLEVGGGYHPRISWTATGRYARLDAATKAAFDDMANDFMHHRHSDWWLRRGRRSLSAVIDATDMLACGEDLGMVPADVPAVMRDLGLLSLEIERMPKRLGARMADPAAAPYLSVVSPGTHDMSTLRMWWEEDPSSSQQYWNQVLGHDGDAPPVATPDILALILERHLASRAMLCIAPLADWFGIDPELRVPDDAVTTERINVPAERHHNWSYRMHVTVEDLQAATGFTDRLRAMIEASGR